MRKISQIIARRLAFATMVAAATFHGPVPAFAADVELTLLGYRWEKSTVTYSINAGGGVSDSAIADVLTAIDDWNVALAEVPEAPALVMASSRKQADILIDMKARVTRNLFGGDHALVGGYWSLPKTSGCVFEAQHFYIQGSLLADSNPDGHAAIRNLARNLLGRALGLENLADLEAGSTGPDAVDVHISACDIAGIAAIYTAASCDQIPASIICGGE
jgi:hypothetical protein